MVKDAEVFGREALEDDEKTGEMDFSIFLKNREKKNPNPTLD